MATKVSFVGKDGKPASVVFPTRTLAEMYARGVKAPTFTDMDLALPEVNVRKCGEMESGMVESEDKDDGVGDLELEAYMEAGCGVVCDGGSSSDALDAANESAYKVREEHRSAEYVCSCGKRCAKGRTSCYTCARYGG